MAKMLIDPEFALRYGSSDAMYMAIATKSARVSCATDAYINGDQRPFLYPFAVISADDAVIVVDKQGLYCAIDGFVVARFSGI